MGLDMYLNAKRYLWHDETELKAQLAAVMPNSPGEPQELTVRVLYWRKANAIHAWFVTHVQDGKDDCHEVSVSLKDLTVLRDTCREVLADHKKAPTLLPTQEGFFFGGTEYDKYYFDDLMETDAGLTKIIDRAEDYTKWDFTYHSYW